MKKAPKTMISQMMKSSIPSSWGSTREERLAGGGPWCSWSSWAWAIAAASMTLPRRPPRRGSAATTCSTGLFVALRTRSIRSARSQPERVAGSVEITMSSTRKNCSAFIVAV